MVADGVSAQERRLFRKFSISPSLTFASKAIACLFSIGKREEARALSAQFPKLSVFNSSKKFWKLKLEGLCHNQCDAFNMWSVSCDWRTHNPLIDTNRMQESFCGFIKHFAAVGKILLFTVLSFRNFSESYDFHPFGKPKGLGFAGWMTPK